MTSIGVFFVSKIKKYPSQGVGAKPFRELRLWRMVFLKTYAVGIDTLCTGFRFYKEDQSYLFNVHFYCKTTGNIVKRPLTEK